MTEIKYDESKGSDKSTVITDGGEVVRAQNVNSVSGQVIYDKSKGSTQCTVITEDGKTVRAMNVVNLGEGGGGGSTDYTKTVQRVETMPVASANNVNQQFLYAGATDANYTHDYIYENVPTTTSSSATATQTVGATLSDIAVDLETLESFTGWTTDNSLQIFYTADGWSVDTTSLGVTYTGTPNVGDAITITYTAAVTTYSWTRVDVQPNSGGAVSSVNGETGDVVLNAKKVNAVPQYETMPTASASNVGELAQYNGTTIPDVPASAVATQTVGSSLGDLQVNVDTFIGVEQPSGAETVSFVADVEPDTSVVDDASAGLDYTFDGQTVIDYFNSLWGYHSPNMDTFVWGITYAVYTGGGATDWVLSRNQDGSNQWSIVLPDGITINSTPNLGDYIAINSTMGSTTWSKNSTTVDIAAYGISYSGIPADGDTISVAYTPFVAGITNGYFYKSSVEYSDPVATISQTAGSGLTGLAVNVDTFIEAEQPTQDETVDFTAIVTPDSVVYDPDKVSDPNSYLMTRISEMFGTENIYIVIGSVDENNVATSAQAFNQTGGFFTITEQDLVDNNVVISNVSASDTIYLTFVQGTTTWEKDSETVDLATYGISFSGTPNNGDTLTVAYTAPAPIGYYWNRTDVQPSSGGGNASIEWKIKSDLEVGDNGYRFLTIPGGLPSGVYEYYIQIKRTPGEFDYRPLGYATYKVIMKINAENGQLRALVNPVLDGDYATTVYAQLRNTDGGESVYISGSDMTFVLLSFRTNIPDYSPIETIVDCYKLSAIKNVDTNQEYVGTLSNTAPEQYDEMWSISYIWGTVDEMPYIPRYASSGTLDFDNGDYINVSDKYYGSNTVMLRIGFRYGFDEYEADMALYRDGHSIKVRKATGVFAQTEFVKDEDRRIFIKLNAPVGTTGSFVYVVGGISEDSIGGMSMQTPTGTPTVLSTDMVGSVIDTNNIDIISQYFGTTTSSYTNGCFYKATGTIVTLPESATCTETTSTGTTITCTNVSGLINKMASLTGWSTDYVKESIGQNFFNVPQDQTSVYYSGYGYWYGQDAADLIACFSFSPALSDSIDFKVQYVPETQEVQNGAWVLVDTQFTGITGYDATKTQVLKNVQGVLTWVDE